MPKIDTSATATGRSVAKKAIKSLEEKGFLAIGARVWDGLSGALEAVSSPLCVREGRLVAIGEAALRAGEDLRRVDLSGRVVMPGLVDAHVHLELDPALRTPREQLAVPEATRRDAMAARARAMLHAGITTARDCGGGAHREHALRDEIARGLRPGPRLLCCGQPITTPGGHCAFWGGEVETRDEIERMVTLQLEAGSDWIKLMATGGVFTPGSRARDSQFDVAQLRVAVEAAARGGRSVAAHCHGSEGIARAVAAGVRTIEHASFAGPEGFGTALDEALMAEMAGRELWVSPTVNVGWGRRIRDERGEPTDFFRRMSTALRAQRDAGIRFIASTDAGIPGVGHADLVEGLIAFETFAALRPVEVLRAATSEAARALGLEGETGRIAPGLAADLLVLERDPLENLSALRDPEVVVAGGRWLDRSVRTTAAA